MTVWGCRHVISTVTDLQKSVRKDVLTHVDRHCGGCRIKRGINSLFVNEDCWSALISTSACCFVSYLDSDICSHVWHDLHLGRACWLCICSCVVNLLQVC